MTSKNKNPLSITQGALAEKGNRHPYISNNWKGSEEIQAMRKLYKELHQNKTFSIIPKNYGDIN